MFNYGLNLLLYTFKGALFKNFELLSCERTQYITAYNLLVSFFGASNANRYSVKVLGSPILATYALQPVVAFKTVGFGHLNFSEFRFQTIVQHNELSMIHFRFTQRHFYILARNIHVGFRPIKQQTLLSLGHVAPQSHFGFKWGVVGLCQRFEANKSNVMFGVRVLGPHVSKARNHPLLRLSLCHPVGKFII